MRSLDLSYNTTLIIFYMPLHLPYLSWCISLISFCSISSTTMAIYPTTYFYSTQTTTNRHLSSNSFTYNSSYRLPIHKRKKHRTYRTVLFLTSDYLSSRNVSIQVLSAFEGLTTVFGMGTGGTPQLSSLDSFFLKILSHPQNFTEDLPQSFLRFLF